MPVNVSPGVKSTATANAHNIPPMGRGITRTTKISKSSTKMEAPTYAKNGKSLSGTSLTRFDHQSTSSAMYSLMTSKGRLLMSSFNQSIMH
ncbi:hypothetical protein [Moraxella lacunata]|uniref:hypothetical protein n=1 Tax=Moraxella lacunata TaxID=477 RepID=UPI003EDECCA1